MDFEYDPKKSQLNLSKHGISLEEAKKLWQVGGWDIPARIIKNEQRFLRIAKLEGKFYSCVYIVRGGLVRLISARRSREVEIKIYQERSGDEKKAEEN